MAAAPAASSGAASCRKSSTGAFSFLFLLFLFLFLLAGAARRGAGEGGVVDRPRGLPVVLLAEQGEGVDAGGAGDVIAPQRLRPAPGVSVPGDVMRGGRP